MPHGIIDGVVANLRRLEEHKLFAVDLSTLITIQKVKLRPEPFAGDAAVAGHSLEFLRRVIERDNNRARARDWIEQASERQQQGEGEGERQGERQGEFEGVREWDWE